MSQARRPRKGAGASNRLATEGVGSPAVKVVLMELTRATRPLSTPELRERTLLSAGAIESALTALREQEVCLERPGDDRRPPRYEAALPRSTSD